MNIKNLFGKDTNKVVELCIKWIVYHNGMRYLLNIYARLHRL